jgi:hypothetical protein
MAPRSELQTILKTLLGSNNVYFQPPPSINMKYPCIVYKRDSARTVFAENKPYRHTKRYQVIVIDSNPDSDIPAKIAALPMCIFDRFYPADNLNHDVFNIFF